MTTGDYLVQHSTLSSGTALEHFMALQIGTGQGTVFASMFSVCVEEPRLTLVQRVRKDASESVERVLREIDERNDDVFVLTGEERLSVMTLDDELTVTTESESSVFVQSDVDSATVQQSDVLEMIDG